MPKLTVSYGRTGGWTDPNCRKTSFLKMKHDLNKMIEYLYPTAIKTYEKCKNERIKVCIILTQGGNKR